MNATCRGFYIRSTSRYMLCMTFIRPCITNRFPNYINKMQRFLIYLFLQMLYMLQAVPPPNIRSTELYIQLQVLSTNTAASCYRGWDGTPFHLIHDSSKQQYWLTIPEAVCTVLCSWWWAEEPPATCTASVGINKSRNIASCWCKLEIHAVLSCTHIQPQFDGA